MTTVELVTEGEHEHTLVITQDAVCARYALTGEQLMLLAYRIIATLWSHYRLDPRD